TTSIAGPVAAGGGATTTLLTDTVTPGDVARLPAPSRAMAVSVCTPSAVAVVSQRIEEGAAIISTPRFTPSSCTCTPAIPLASVAFADTVTLPEAVDPSAGATIATTGGVASAGDC